MNFDGTSKMTLNDGDRLFVACGDHQIEISGFGPNSLVLTSVLKFRHQEAISFPTGESAEDYKSMIHGCERFNGIRVDSSPHRIMVSDGLGAGRVNFSISGGG